MAQARRILPALRWPGLLGPMAQREMRARMRGPRSFIILAIHLAILTGVTYGVYLRGGGGAPYSYGYGSYPVGGNNNGILSFGPTQSYKLGQNVFIALNLTLLCLAALVTPALTASAISRERENRTYDLLFSTPVGARSIVMGKMLAALGYVFLLDLASLPLMSIVFVFGGVTISNLIVGYALVLVTTAAFGMLGVLFSAITRHTATATILTYTIVALLLLGTVLVSTFWQAGLVSATNRLSIAARSDQAIQQSYEWPKRILAVDPIAAVGSILAPNAPLVLDSGELAIFPNTQLFGGTGRNNTPDSTNDDRPLWFYTLTGYSVATCLFLVLSVFAARPSGMRLGRLPLSKRRKRKDQPGISAPPEVDEVPPVEEKVAIPTEVSSPIETQPLG